MRRVIRMKLPISRLNHKVKFGKTETISDESIEGSHESFITRQQLHCAFYQRSQTQQYQLLGTKLEGTIVIAIRSQYHVEDDLQAQIDDDNTIYNIVTISRDESHSPIRYDLITLKDTGKKVG